MQLTKTTILRWRNEATGESFEMPVTGFVTTDEALAILSNWDFGCNPADTLTMEVRYSNNV